MTLRDTTSITSIRTGSLLFLIVLLLACTGLEPKGANAQTGEDAWLLTERLPATGPRLAGMGGASVGGVGNVHAMFTNPAGLGYMMSSEASGAINAMGMSSDARYLVTNSTGTNEQTFHLTPSNANLVYKFPTQRGSLVMAGGLNQYSTYNRTFSYDAVNMNNTMTATFLPFDAEYTIRDDFRPEFGADMPFVAYEAGAIEFYPDDFDDGFYPFEQAVLLGDDNRQVGEVVERGNLTEANIAGAIEAAENFMLGVSGNIIFGEYTRDHFHRETLEQPEGVPYEVVRDGELYSGFEQLDFTDRRRSQVSGANLRLGASWWAAPGFRIGASFETPTFYQIENRFGIRMETFFADGGSLFYSEQSGEFERSNYEYNIVTPWRASLGGKVLARDFDGITGEFVLTADVEFVDWSQLELRAGGDDFFYEDTNRQIRDNFGSVLNTRVGGELYVHQAVGRVGFAFYPDPRNERVVSTEYNVSDRDRMTLSLGLGYEVRPGLQFDIAWMRNEISESFYPYVDPDEGLTSPPVVDDFAQDHVIFGVTYQF